MRRINACLLLALAAGAASALEINQASLAELESIKGIGPDLAERILAERGRSEFKSWDDLRARVKGLGARAAARLSEAGLSVQGAAYPARAASAPH